VQLSEIEEQILPLSKSLLAGEKLRIAQRRK
jgi:hypothetical protein